MYDLQKKAKLTTCKKQKAKPKGVIVTVMHPSECRDKPKDTLESEIRSAILHSWHQQRVVALASSACANSSSAFALDHLRGSVRLVFAWVYQTGKST